jgi:hypothetical protein
VEICLKLLSKTAAIIILVVLTCFGASSQTDRADKNLAQQIEKLEQTRLDAYLHLDARTLDRLMTDDYTSVYANGEIGTRATELAGVKSAPAGSLSAFTANIDKLSVQSLGNAAVLKGRLTLKGKLVWSEKNIDLNASFRYTAIYVKIRDSWQISFSQFTAIEPETDK